MNGKCEHSPAKRSDRCDTTFIDQRAQIEQQFFGVRKRRIAWRLEPSEVAKVFDTSRLQCEDDFGKIEPLDFRQFLRGALSMLRL